MCPVHRCGSLAESLVNEKRREKLKYAVVYFTTFREKGENKRQMLLKKGTLILYKIFFIM